MSNTSKLAYVILAILIGYIFIYPKTGEVSLLMAEKQKYESYLETLGSIESKKNELLTEFNKISVEDKKDIETILPNSLDFVKLMSQIDSVAAKYGILIDKITSKETSLSVGDSIENAQPQKIYNSAIIGFSFTASYNDFNNFMNDLEKSLRILDIKSIKLEVREKGAYSYNVEFETYWLKK